MNSVIIIMYVDNIYENNNTNYLFAHIRRLIIIIIRLLKDPKMKLSVGGVFNVHFIVISYTIKT